MTKLVFIGGAPAVGKSVVAKELLARLDKCVWLDGDDLWRMHPFLVNETTKNMVEQNIRSVLRSFLETGFSFVLFTWVLHDKSIVERLLRGLCDELVQFLMFTLICDEPTLLSRLSLDGSRSTNSELALQRLRQTLTLDSVKIDTSKKTPSAVADEIVKAVVA